MFKYAMNLSAKHNKVTSISLNFNKNMIENSTLNSDQIINTNASLLSESLLSNSFNIIDLKSPDNINVTCTLENEPMQNSTHVLENAVKLITIKEESQIDESLGILSLNDMKDFSFLKDTAEAQDLTLFAPKLNFHATKESVNLQTPTKLFNHDSLISLSPEIKSAKMPEKQNFADAPSTSTPKGQTSVSLNEINITSEDLLCDQNTQKVSTPLNEHRNSLDIKKPFSKEIPASIIKARPQSPFNYAHQESEEFHLPCDERKISMNSTTFTTPRLKWNTNTELEHEDKIINSVFKKDDKLFSEEFDISLNHPHHLLLNSTEILSPKNEQITSKNETFNMDNNTFGILTSYPHQNNVTNSSYINAEVQSKNNESFNIDLNTSPKQNTSAKPKILNSTFELETPKKNPSSKTKAFIKPPHSSKANVKVEEKINITFACNDTITLDACSNNEADATFTKKDKETYNLDSGSKHITVESPTSFKGQVNASKTLARCNFSKERIDSIMPQRKMTLQINESSTRRLSGCQTKLPKNGDVRSKVNTQTRASINPSLPNFASGLRKFQAKNTVNMNSTFLSATDKNNILTRKPSASTGTQSFIKPPQPSKHALKDSDKQKTLKIPNQKIFQTTKSPNKTFIPATKSNTPQLSNENVKENHPTTSRLSYSKVSPQVPATKSKSQLSKGLKVNNTTATKLSNAKVGLQAYNKLPKVEKLKAQANFENIKENNPVASDKTFAFKRPSMLQPVSQTRKQSMPLKAVFQPKPLVENDKVAQRHSMIPTTSKISSSIPMPKSRSIPRLQPHPK